VEKAVEVVRTHEDGTCRWTGIQRPKQRKVGAVRRRTPKREWTPQGRDGGGENSRRTQVPREARRSRSLDAVAELRRIRFVHRRRRNGRRRQT
jgi:hypothetical protein